MPELEVFSDNVFLIRQLLTPEECADYITFAEREGFADAPITTAAGPVMRKGVRNNERVMVDDTARAAALWERVLEHFPEYWRHVRAQGVLAGQELEPCGLNERLRFYRYEPGQRFRLHRDGCYRRPSGEEESLLTALFYLNEDFEGGATAIIEPGHGCEIQPEVGDALFFLHYMLHEGQKVEEGTKYVLRSDVMYRAAEHPQQ